MNSTVSLDSFQLIIGLYLLYVTIKGHGTMYNFFDIPEKTQAMVKPRLRLIYGICAVIALGEAGLCMWQGTAGQEVMSAATVSTISTVCTLIIVLCFAGILIWLRKLAKGK